MTDAQPFLPYGRQDIDDDDVAAAVAVLRSDWLTQGPATPAFEAKLAAKLGAAEAVACATGTAALHLALAALDLAPGDAVAVPANTFLATANAVRLAGGEVAFADVDPDAGLTTPAHLAAALDRAAAAGWRARALLPVHFAGQTVDMPGTAALAQARGGLAVIEDACHAIGGAAVSGDGTFRPVGACADSLAACFSFHPVKTIAAGEGGAVTVNDPALAARLRRLRNHGMIREGFSDAAAALDTDGTINPWHYEMPEVGLNYRLTDLQAALAASQLRRLDAFIDRRRALMDLYDRLLAPLAPWVRPIRRVDGCRPGWHLCAVRIDFAGLGVTRAAVMNGLRARGVGSQVHYIPVHRQPYYRERYGLLSLPGAEARFAQTLSLPLYPGLSDADVVRVVVTLATTLGLAPTL